MKPTDQLKAEHEGIKIMLQILDKVVARQELNEGHFTKILEFLKVFVDKCHHGKEEDLLLPAMVEAGVSKDKGIITEILREHSEGRGYVLGMSKAFDKLKNGDHQVLSEIGKNIKNYIVLLTRHITKENNVFFPLADKVLSPAKQNELEEGFEKLEVERIGLGKHEEFHKLLNHLEEEYVRL